MAAKVWTHDCEDENEKCEKIDLLSGMHFAEGVYLNEGNVATRSGADLLCAALQFGHVPLEKTFLLTD